MDIYKVIVGEYDSTTYYIVKGAQDGDDALAQVKAWYNKNYSGGWPEYEPVEIEEIKIKKGVTRL